VTHGYTRQVVQALLEIGFDAREVKTEFSGDEEAASESPESAADPQSGEVAS
jgi:hypothetical protein